jgi:O-antigen/teichoic acid export membrane protein
MKDATVRRVLKNTLAVYGKNGFDTAVGLFSIAILARYFNLADFGRYSFIIALVTIFKVVSTMGIDTIFTREVAKDREKAVRFYSSTLIIQLVFSAVTFVIIAIVINIVSSSEIVIKATYLCAIAVIFEFMGKTFSSVFQAFERMEFDTYKTVLSQGAYLLGIVSVAKFDLGLFGVFYALVFAFLLDMMFGFFVVHKIFIKFRLKGNLTEVWFITKEAIPLGVKRIVRKIGFRIDTLILAALKSTIEVGLFHGVYKIIQALIVVAEGSLQAVFPILSKHYGSSQASFDTVYEKSFKFLTIIGIPFAVFLSAFSHEAITLVLGKKFVAAVPALQILSWVIALMFLSNLMERLLIAGGKQTISTWVSIIALAINVIFDFLLIPRWSIIGASIATLIAELLITVLSFYYVYKLISKKQVLGEALKPLCSGIITFAILYLLRDTNFFWAVILGFFSYFTLLILTKTFTTEERLMLWSALKKKGHVS